MVFSRKRKDNRSPSLIIDDSPKRTKVQAQRKFAAGSNINSPAITPIKELENVEKSIPEPIDLVPMKRPNTEDFLTFLCFRGTPVLPQSLNFFNNASMLDTRQNEASTSPKNGVIFPQNKSAERPFIAFGVRKRADPIVVSRHMDKKRRHALALQALRRKYQEQKMAKIRAITISKLSEKVHTNKTIVRTTRSITKTGPIHKKNAPQKTKITVVATKLTKVTTRRRTITNTIGVKNNPKMCLRSLRTRFANTQKNVGQDGGDLGRKLGRKPPLIRNVINKRVGDEKGVDVSGSGDEEEEEFSSDDDEPLVSAVKANKKGVKKSLVEVKKLADNSVRMTRSTGLTIKPLSRVRRVPIKNRLLVRTQSHLKSPPSTPRLRAQRNAKTIQKTQIKKPLTTKTDLIKKPIGVLKRNLRKIVKVPVIPMKKIVNKQQIKTKKMAQKVTKSDFKDVASTSKKDEDKKELRKVVTKKETPTNTKKEPQKLDTKDEVTTSKKDEEKVKGNKKSLMQKSTKKLNKNEGSKMSKNDNDTPKLNKKELDDFNAKKKINEMIAKKLDEEIKAKKLHEELITKKKLDELKVEENLKQVEEAQKAKQKPEKRISLTKKLVEDPTKSNLIKENPKKIDASEENPINVKKKAQPKKIDESEDNPIHLKKKAQPNKKKLVEEPKKKLEKKFESKKNEGKTSKKIEEIKVAQRPSRKTKEAASIYMEILGHKLVHDEEFDDNVSIDSFPELPNVRKMEQRENELKAIAKNNKSFKSVENLDTNTINKNIEGEKGKNLKNFEVEAQKSTNIDNKNKNFEAQKLKLNKKIEVEKSKNVEIQKSTNIDNKNKHFEAEKFKRNRNFEAERSKNIEFEESTNIEKCKTNKKIEVEKLNRNKNFEAEKSKNIEFEKSSNFEIEKLKRHTNFEVDKSKNIEFKKSTNNEIEKLKSNTNFDVEKSKDFEIQKLKRNTNFDVEKSKDFEIQKLKRNTNFDVEKSKDFEIQKLKSNTNFDVEKSEDFEIQKLKRNTNFDVEKSKDFEIQKLKSNTHFDVEKSKYFEIQKLKSNTHFDVEKSKDFEIQKLKRNTNFDVEKSKNIEVEKLNKYINFEVEEAKNIEIENVKCFKNIEVETANFFKNIVVEKSKINDNENLKKIELDNLKIDNKESDDNSKLIESNKSIVDANLLKNIELENNKLTKIADKPKKILSKKDLVQGMKELANEIKLEKQGVALLQEKMKMELTMQENAFEAEKLAKITQIASTSQPKEHKNTSFLNTTETSTLQPLTDENIIAKAALFQEKIMQQIAKDVAKLAMKKDVQTQNKDLLKYKKLVMEKGLHPVKPSTSLDCFKKIGKVEAPNVKFPKLLKNKAVEALDLDALKEDKVLKICTALDPLTPNVCKESNVLDDVGSKLVQSATKTKLVENLDLNLVQVVAKSKQFEDLDTKLVQVGNKSKQIENVDTKLVQVGNKSKQIENMDSKLVQVGNKSKQIENFHTKLVQVGNKSKQIENMDSKLVQVGNKSKQIENFDTKLVQVGNKSKQIENFDTKLVQVGNKSKQIENVDTKLVQVGNKSKQIENLDTKLVQVVNKSKLIENIDSKLVQIATKSGSLKRKSNSKSSTKSDESDDSIKHPSKLRKSENSSKKTSHKLQKLEKSPIITMEKRQTRQKDNKPILEISFSDSDPSFIADVEAPAENLGGRKTRNRSPKLYKSFSDTESESEEDLVQVKLSTKRNFDGSEESEALEFMNRVKKSKKIATKSFRDEDEEALQSEASESSNWAKKTKKIAIKPKLDKSFNDLEETLQSEASESLNRAKKSKKIATKMDEKLLQSEASTSKSKNRKKIIKKIANKPKLDKSFKDSEEELLESEASESSNWEKKSKKNATKLDEKHLESEATASKFTNRKNIIKKIATKPMNISFNDSEEEPLQSEASESSKKTKKFATKMDEKLLQSETSASESTKRKKIIKKIATKPLNNSFSDSDEEPLVHLTQNNDAKKNKTKDEKKIKASGSGIKETLLDLTQIKDEAKNIKTKDEKKHSMQNKEDANKIKSKDEKKIEASGSGLHLTQNKNEANQIKTKDQKKIDDKLDSSGEKETLVQLTQNKEDFSKIKTKDGKKIEASGSGKKTGKRATQLESENIIGSKVKRECTKRPQNYLPTFSSSDEEDQYFHGFVAPKSTKIAPAIELFCNKDLGRRYGKEKVNMSHEQIEKWLEEAALAGLSLKKENDEMLKFGEKIPTEICDVVKEEIVETTPEKQATTPTKPLSNERKSIFRKEPITPTTRKINAFSVANESSVYAFDADPEGFVSAPFRRPNRRPSSTGTSNNTEDESNKLDPELQQKGMFRLPGILRKSDPILSKNETSTKKFDASGVDCEKSLCVNEDLRNPGEGTHTFYVPLQPGHKLGPKNAKLTQNESKKIGPNLRGNKTLFESNLRDKNLIEYNLRNNKNLIGPNLRHKTLIEPNLRDNKTLIDPNLRDKTLIEPNLRDNKTLFESNLRDNTLIESNLRDNKTLFEPNFRDKTFFESNLRDKTLIEQNLRDNKTLIEQSLRDKTLFEQNLRDNKTLIEQNLRDKTLFESNLRDKILIEPNLRDNKTLFESNLRDKTLIEYNLRDNKTLIDPNLRDKTLFEPNLRDKNLIESNLTDNKNLIESNLRDKNLIEPNLRDNNTLFEPNLRDKNLIESNLRDHKNLIEPNLRDNNTLFEPNLRDNKTLIEPNLRDKTLFEPNLRDNKTLIEPNLRNSHNKTLIKGLEATQMYPPSNSTQKNRNERSKFGSSKSFDRSSETSEEFKYKVPTSPSVASSSSSAKLSNKRPTNNKSKQLYAPVNVTEFPNHLDEPKIVEAPVFHPNEKEFSDPLEYIEKIRAQAEKFGVCRIIPPKNFKPECKVLDEMRFTAYNQYVHKMMDRWGPNFRELVVIRKYLSTQSISLNHPHPPWIGGMEIDLPRLYQTVQSLGGLSEVIDKKKWARVSELMKIPKSAQDRFSKLDDIYIKYLLPYDTLSPDERDKLFDAVETDWAKRESKNLLQVQQEQRKVGEEEEEVVEGEEDDEDEEDSEDEQDTECIVKGRSMALNQFYRIARNTMAMWFKGTQPEAHEVEEEFWKHVTTKQNHICVHSGSIDSGNWGYGFAITKNSPFARHAWNLKVLTNNSGSILRSMGPVMGLTVPTLHVGMVFSGCCWYRDPHSLPWIEYLHTGANKIWYGIPDNMSDKFHATLTKLVPNYCLNKQLWLPTDTAMLPPQVLINHGVSLTRTVQAPGEFVVIFQKAFTSNICTGYSVSESVFFATPDWLSNAQSVFATLRACAEPSMFSYERLLLCIAVDARSDVNVLRRVVPEVQRLCEREKREREGLLRLGVQCGARLPLPDKKKKKGNEVETEYDCDDCRWNLFCSMVCENEETYYCLEHATQHIQNKRLEIDKCKLLYTYDLSELEAMTDKIRATIEMKIQKKAGSKFTGMATLLNR